MRFDLRSHPVRARLWSIGVASLLAATGCGHGASGGAGGLPQGIDATAGSYSGVYAQSHAGDSCCWVAKSARFKVPVPAGSTKLAFKFFVPNGVGDYDRMPADVTIAVAGGPSTRRDHLGPGMATIIVPLAGATIPQSGADVTMTMGRTFIPPGGPPEAPISVILLSVTPS